MNHNKILNLRFASSLTNITEVNSSFDRGILRIAYPGDNQNMTNISRSAFEKAMPSIYNVPVVANYNVSENSIGGHDMGVVRTDDGSLRLINYTEPLGVVPESAQHFFETVEEDDGTTHDYLYTEVLLWKRQPVYSKIKEDGVTDHSMEIKVKDGYMENNIFHIEDYEYTAFCLLGDGIEPCFESSSLEVFSANFKKQMSEMMQELKDTYSLVESSNDDTDIDNNKYSTEGGEKALDVKMELAASYGIDVDSLDFSIEDYTVEELTEKFEAMKSDNEVNTEDIQDENINDEASDKTFALTQQVIDEIYRILGEEKIETSWGIESRYCYIDCDLESNEVYAYDCKDWLIYGFTYSKNGDSISIDFESKKRKKFAIVDFEGEDQSQSPIAGIFNRVDEAMSENAGVQEKFEQVSTELSNAQSELEDLRRYKADAESAKATAARDEVFAMFEDLNGIEVFESLRENCNDMDVNTLKKECFAIRGEFGTQLKFASAESNKAPKILIDKSEAKPTPYGGIVEKYASKTNS